MPSAIPIQNIYYLLCYAWNKLAESELVRVESQAHHSLFDLLAQVLGNGLRHVIRLGLARDYVGHVEEISTIRGRLQFDETLRRTFFRSPRVYCRFDDFSHDILPNQIIKATLRRLLRYPELDKEIRASLFPIFRRLDAVSDIALVKRHFGLVQLHSNNGFYQFLLNVCELIHDASLPSEGNGDTRFRDFERDENKMPHLFEEFVRNFYAREALRYRVSRKELQWKAEAVDDFSRQMLPSMKTDIFLESSERVIIIDCKFYKEALQRNFDTEKIRNDHLYQINTYLQNAGTDEDDPRTLDGILLYPTVRSSQPASYQLSGYTIGIRSINLDQDWQGIHRDLLAIVD
ncbi:MAG: 5-methylcytosine-specific restriction endonuclease system specificity protein McrC [Ectothiorhodospiraceae bacterium]|nr:5-methylcytosine-specific restriction endonuclease system specificity protein McrC [Ectothiorhodospiraceae bacterium]